MGVAFGQSLEGTFIMLFHPQGEIVFIAKSADKSCLARARNPNNRG